ncbi:MAG TPA: acyclic terpene utilization AtuA family protein [Streptosporangiaceae bacterium]
MIRIGNASGFYGDRPGAFRELLETADVDVITGDYLAELTMLILARDKARDPSLGYARTFIAQFEDCIGLAIKRNVRLVVNAGGLNPAGLASRLGELAAGLGLQVKVAHVEGDDLTHRAGVLGLGQPLTANAYLGGFGIAECLSRGADVVVTGRVTDASLVVGAAAAHFDWSRGDLDAIAGAMAAGHVIECGTQATGGNYAFFRTIPDLRHPGFPIAEVNEDGSSVITKPEGTGGGVTTGTVTAQLLYEVGGARYAGPDAVLRLDSIQLTQEGKDRVRITGVRGEPPPDTLKIGATALGGYRNEVTFVLTGLDIEAKADLVKRQMADVVPGTTTWTLARTDHEDAGTTETASALLHCVARGPDPDAVGRRFSDAAVHIALGSYPGFHLTAPPGAASPYGVFRSASVSAYEVPHVAFLPDAGRIELLHSPLAVPAARALASVPEPLIPPYSERRGATRRVPLGRVIGARSGDKGGDANLGAWVADDRAWPWLAGFLTLDAVRSLLPETAGLELERHVLPNLRAVNVIVRGLLGEGVAYNARFDPQAKALGELLRARFAEVPEELL